MVLPSQRPTYNRLLAPQEPWLKHDGFNTAEWLLVEPHALVWVGLLQKMALVPADLPTSPFFVFGPVLLVHEISNIGKGALDGELSRCRCALADPETAEKANTHLQVLARSLRRGSWLLKEAMKLTTEDGEEGDADGVMRRVLEVFHQNMKNTGLDTLDEIEEFLQNPYNSRVVSITAVYLHLNKMRACQSPGTTRFLDDVQRVALREPWPGSSRSSNDLGLIDDGYCAVVPVDHPALNARAVLVALNFFYFERLKMVPANTADCRTWTGGPELVRQRNQVLHELRANNCAALVPELLKCRFAVEKWFPGAPPAQTTAVIEDSGPVAQGCFETILAALPTAISRSPMVAPSSPASSTTSQGLFVSQRPDVEAPPAEAEAQRKAKAENPGERKAKKLEKNRRQKEANKRRRLAKREVSKATITNASEADTTEPNPPVKSKVPVESKASAIFQASDVIASDALTVPKPPAQDDAKHDEKAKRKAKEQRRKERRQLERQAEAEKKRLVEEAKARAREEHRRQQEHQRRKDLEEKRKENQRREEALRRCQQEEKARVLEQAASRERAKKAQREKIEREVEEARRAKEAEEARRARDAETHRIKEAETRRAETGCIAREETRRVEEVRVAEEARRAEEVKRVEKARLVEEARRAEEVRRAEEARLAEKARLAEEVKRVEEAKREREARRLEEARLAEVEARRAQEARIAREHAAHLSQQAYRTEVRRGKEAQRADDARHTERVHGTHLAETADARHGEETWVAAETKVREQEAELRKRQRAYLWRVDAEELRKRQQDALYPPQAGMQPRVNTARKHPASPVGERWNHYDQQPQQSVQHDGQYQAPRVRETHQHHHCIGWASEAQTAISPLRRLEQGYQQLAEDGRRFVLAIRQARDASQRADEKAQRVTVAYTRVVATHRGVDALEQALLTSQPAPAMPSSMWAAQPLQPAPVLWPSQAAQLAPTREPAQTRQSVSAREATRALQATIQPSPAYGPILGFQPMHLARPIRPDGYRQSLEQTAPPQTRQVASSQELQSASSIHDAVNLPTTSSDLENHVDNVIAGIIRPHGRWDPEALYRRAPRNPAHSRARSVDRDEFAIRG